MILPTATYRLQLRNGVDFAQAQKFLLHAQSLGASHLYLSPIFTAQPGSTHGYDVTDPGQIDSALGGRDGFIALSQAAKARGMGLILDLVPNHTAFSLDNPWLCDVLRKGRDSRYAAHFDIDWDEGPLILPWLEQPFEAALANGMVSHQGGCLRIGDLDIPACEAKPTTDLTALHEAQIWRAVHWERERDGVTHRRFFNVTGLIGMRVEDPAVFHDMHALTADLVRGGHVQGLRVDHVDGLADPAGYLSQLRVLVGNIPVWVEKILTGDEVLPDWPVQGTTGYEATTMLARTLSDARGAASLLAEWTAQTGGPKTFHASLTAAKGDVIRRDLAAELRRLITLTRRACNALPEVDPGDEALREALMALLIAFPRYRTYLSDAATPADDVRLTQDVAQTAGATLRAPDVVDLITRMITAPKTAPERALQTRFQQVTGALLAKSHEDTAGFRWTPYLVACEVGADPDTPTTDASALQAWARAQPGSGLLLSSSHDAKRSEDARMRLAAWTYLPDDALSLIAAATDLPEANDVPPNVLWYLVQSTLALWDQGSPDALSRLTDHTTKALREADEITSWTHPNKGAETTAHYLLNALCDRWRAAPPGALTRIIEKGTALSLAHLALKMMLPGVPDIYRGSENAYFALTDPDNRHPVDTEVLALANAPEGLSRQKRDLLTTMTTLRRDHAEIFAKGEFVAETVGPHLAIRREWEGNSIQLTLSLSGGDVGPGNVWPRGNIGLPCMLAISVLPEVRAA